MKSKVLALLLLLVTLFVAACVPGVRPSPTNPTVVVPPTPKECVRYVNFKVYDPVYVAIEKGFFEKRGVCVEIVGDVLAGPTAIQAVAAGIADAGLSSVPALINANAAGLPVQGVVDIQTSMPGQALQKWYVRRDSPYRSVSDLKGARFAINLVKSSFHYTAMMKMEQEGLDANTVKWPLLSFDKQIPALIAGEIDVMGLMQPYQGFAEREYGDKIRVLFNDFDDVFGGQTRHVSLIFINRTWAKFNPGDAKAFVAGVSDAINWIEGNQDEARQIVSRYTGIPADAIPDYHFTPGGQVRPQDIAWWLNYLMAEGDITATWIEPDMVATDAYGE